MSTNTPTQSALAVMANRLQCDSTKLLDTLKQTAFKGATNEELMALVIVANQYGLSPFTKELYAFPAKGGGIVPVVSVDGWLRMMNDHPQMDGYNATYAYDDGKLESCTVTIHRKDRAHPVVVTEFLAECKRATDPWKMEHRMLRHKATIQAARVAFGFSGIYDEDEAKGIPMAAGRVVEEKKPFTPPTPKQSDPEPLVLSDAPETNLEYLRRRIKEDDLDPVKVDAWIAENSFPDLEVIMESEATEICSLYRDLKKEAAR